jgi:hypothetical protein
MPIFNTKYWIFGWMGRLMNDNCNYTLPNTVYVSGTHTTLSFTFPCLVLVRVMGHCLCFAAK